MYKYTYTYMYTCMCMRVYTHVTCDNMVYACVYACYLCTYTHVNCDT